MRKIIILILAAILLSGCSVKNVISDNNTDITTTTSIETKTTPLTNTVESSVAETGACPNNIYDNDPIFDGVYKTVTYNDVTYYLMKKVVLYKHIGKMLGYGNYGFEDASGTKSAPAFEISGISSESCIAIDFFKNEYGTDTHYICYYNSLNWDDEMDTYIWQLDSNDKLYDKIQNSDETN